MIKDIGSKEAKGSSKGKGRETQKKTYELSTKNAIQTLSIFKGFSTESPPILEREKLKRYSPKPSMRTR